MNIFQKFPDFILFQVLKALSVKEIFLIVPLVNKSLRNIVKSEIFQANLLPSLSPQFELFGQLPIKEIIKLIISSSELNFWGFKTNGGCFDFKYQIYKIFMNSKYSQIVFNQIDEPFYIQGFPSPQLDVFKQSLLRMQEFSQIFLNKQPIKILNDICIETVFLDAFIIQANRFQMQTPLELEFQRILCNLWAQKMKLESLTLMNQNSFSFEDLFYQKDPSLKQVITSVKIKLSGNFSHKPKTIMIFTTKNGIFSNFHECLHKDTDIYQHLIYNDNKVAQTNLLVLKNKSRFYRKPSQNEVIFFDFQGQVSYSIFEQDKNKDENLFLWAEFPNQSTELSININPIGQHVTLGLKIYVIKSRKINSNQQKGCGFQFISFNGFPIK